MTRRLPLICMLGLLVLLSGCGYKAGGPYRSDIGTVYVEIFGSKEFRRDLEFMLTEAVKKRIGSDTPYRLAARENADTILIGEVLEERQAAFAPDFRSRQPREKQLTLAVRLQWKDIRTGRVLVDQPVQLQAVDYLTPTGETEKFAQERAVDGLAKQIVAKMYEDW
ncbi:MAG: hypothetical protein KAY37_02300 [Phycisphaerae bacterium]|nr:hypothetical protein [Phycisphaerae bacterium]